jgi:hypothetical protein
MTHFHPEKDFSYLKDAFYDVCINSLKAVIWWEQQQACAREDCG